MKPSNPNHDFLMTTIRSIIDQSPYGEGCKKALRKMAPDFQAISKMGCGNVERIRHNLHLLHGARHPLVQGTLFVINRMLKINKSDEPVRVQRTATSP